MAFFFWGFIALIFGAVWLATLVGFISSRFFKSKVVRWLGFIPFAGMTGCAIWIAYNAYVITTPTHAFTISFGFAPTEDVRELQSEYWYFGDTGKTYLKFKAEPQTIQRIVKLGLEKSSSSSQQYSTTGNDVPDWWKYHEKVTTHCYEKSNRRKDFASEEESLCYDERTQQAYYSFLGID